MTAASGYDIGKRSKSRLTELSRRFASIRGLSERICATLEPEDCVIQSMPDVSPIRWHLAHTTWFFETFLLKQQRGYCPINEEFEYLFNSYYNAVGQQYPRDRRGLLSRPTLAEIFEYRRAVDQSVLAVFDAGDASREWLDVVELGLHHEQQHQELMLTDLKHVFSCNPLLPEHVQGELLPANLPEQRWLDFGEGVYEIGRSGDGFAFDNESPRHRVFVEPFRLSNRLITNGEYLQFIEDGGYQRSEFWLSMGWSQVNHERWRAPLYWFEVDGQWHEFTLGGGKPLAADLPVTHVSYFEADAYARWAEARLATEVEWEIAADRQAVSGWSSEEFFDRGAPVHPCHLGQPDTLTSLFGSTWQWTSSSYSPYPGYRPKAGALGEYNGKFMCNQYVLRGSSCATSIDHTRVTYRNFFPPEARWQFTGIRLATSEG